MGNFLSYCSYHSIYVGNEATISQMYNCIFCVVQMQHQPGFSIRFQIFGIGKEITDSVKLSLNVLKRPSGFSSGLL